MITRDCLTLAKTQLDRSSQIMNAFVVVCSSDPHGPIQPRGLPVNRISNFNDKLTILRNRFSAIMLDGSLYNSSDRELVTSLMHEAGRIMRDAELDLSKSEQFCYNTIWEVMLALNSIIQNEVK